MHSKGEDKKFLSHLLLTSFLEHSPTWATS